MKKIVSVLGLGLIAIALGWVCFHYTDLPTLTAAVEDEDGFIFIMIKMKNALLAHDLKGVFSYAFFTYGFLYFFINTLLTWPFMDSAGVGLVVIPRLVSAVFAVGTVVCVYQAARRLCDRPVALAWTALLVSAPELWVVGTWFHPDFPMTFFVAAAMWALISDQFQMEKKYWMAAALLGVAMGLKFQALLFVPVLILYGGWQIMSGEDWRRAIQNTGWVIVGGTALVGTIFLAMNPFLIHPQGLNAFIRFLIEVNLKSNATNFGIVGEIPLMKRIDLGVIRAFFAWPVILAVLALGASRIIQLRNRVFADHSVYWVVALSGASVLGYSLFTLNNMSPHYYIACIVVIVMGIVPVVRGYAVNRIVLILGLLIAVNIGLHHREFASLIHRPKYDAYVNRWAESRAPMAATLRRNLQADDHILASPKALIDFEAIPIPLNQVHRIAGPIELRMFEPEAQLAYFSNLNIPAPQFVPMVALVIDKSDPYFDSNKLARLVERPKYEAGKQLIEGLREGKWGYSIAYEDPTVIVFVHGRPQ